MKITSNYRQRLSLYSAVSLLLSGDDEVLHFLITTILLNKGSICRWFLLSQWLKYEARESLKSKEKRMKKAVSCKQQWNHLCLLCLSYLTSHAFKLLRLQVHGSLKCYFHFSFLLKKKHERVCIFDHVDFIGDSHPLFFYFFGL